MVMPMASSEDKSMFWKFDYNYTYEKERCRTSYGVEPRGRWITTEFGGHVRYIMLCPCLSYVLLLHSDLRFWEMLMFHAGDNIFGVICCCSFF